MRKTSHKYTSEQEEFLAANVEGRYYKDLAALFNNRFNTNLSRDAISAKCGKLGLFNGLNGQFLKGHQPFNKGMKGVTFGGAETQFKKGQKPANYKPVGSERVDRDGYVLIKVSDTGEWHQRWRHKHKVMWEEVNGPIPKGHVLIFLDRDKQNITLENLQLITQAQLVRMNQNKLFQQDPELTKAGVIIASIYTKMGALNRKEKSE